MNALFASGENLRTMEYRGGEILQHLGMLPPRIKYVELNARGFGFLKGAVVSNSLGYCSVILQKSDFAVCRVIDQQAPLSGDF